MRMMPNGGYRNGTGLATIPHVKEIRSWLCVKLIASNQILGLLCSGHSEHHRFTPQHQRLIISCGVVPVVCACMSSSKPLPRINVGTMDLEFWFDHCVGSVFLIGQDGVRVPRLHGKWLHAPTTYLIKFIYPKSRAFNSIPSVRFGTI